VKVKNQLDATKYAVLLPQHVSGTNMPIIRRKIIQEAQHCTTQTAFQVWPPTSGSYLLIVLLMKAILVPETF
jgi:hypothetical protein